MNITTAPTRLLVVFTTAAWLCFSQSHSAAQSWTATTSYPLAGYQWDPVEVGGFVYVIGGYNGNAINHVYYSRIQSDGSLGTWVGTTPHPEADQGPGVAAHNGWIYIALGNGSVYRAQTLPDGGISSWIACPSAGIGHGGRLLLRTHNGFLYIFGGWSPPSAFFSDVFVSSINADGSIGAWNMTTAMPEPRQHQSIHFQNDRAYIIGGIVGVGSILNSVYSAPVDCTGNLGAWRAETNLPFPLWYHNSIIVNNEIHLLGGRSHYGDSGDNDKVYRGIVSPSDGTISEWAIVEDMPDGQVNGKGAVYAPSKGTAYLIGGHLPTYTANVWYKQFVNAVPATPGEVLWQFNVGHADSSPAIGSDGTIYFGSSFGGHQNLFALHPDGTQKWMKNYGGSGQVWNPVVGPDGLVYVVTEDDQKLHVYDADGAEQWARTGISPYTAPAFGCDGRIYIVSNDGKLLALDSNGNLLWFRQTGGVVSSIPAVAADGTIYFGSWDGKLYALNSNGLDKWPPFDTGGPIVYATPAIDADGTIYIGGRGAVFFAINPNGHEKWRYPTANWIETSAAIAADGTIYFGNHDAGQLVALNPDGSFKWSVQTCGKVNSSPAIAADGTIYFGSYDGNLYAVAPSGNVLGKFNAGGWVVSSPSIGNDGTVYFGSTAGGFYALAGTSGLANTPWPKFRRNLQNSGLPNAAETTPPAITCPADITASSGSLCASASGVVTFPPPSAADNCAVTSVVCAPPSGATFPAGATTVTCTATDISGNTAHCTFTVTVQAGGGAFEDIQAYPDRSRVHFNHQGQSEFAFFRGNLEMTGGNLASDFRVVPASTARGALKVTIGGTVVYCKDDLTFTIHDCSDPVDNREKWKYNAGPKEKVFLRWKDDQEYDSTRDPNIPLSAATGNKNIGKLETRFIHEDETRFRYEFKNATKPITITVDGLVLVTVSANGTVTSPFPHWKYGKVVEVLFPDRLVPGSTIAWYADGELSNNGGAPENLIYQHEAVANGNATDTYFNAGGRFFLKVPVSGVTLTSLPRNAQVEFQIGEQGLTLTGCGNFSVPSYTVVGQNWKFNDGPDDCESED